MERITITINTGNAAFDDEPATEIARILREIAASMERDGTPSLVELQDGTFLVRDINGNKCGEVDIAPEVDDEA